MSCNWFPTKVYCFHECLLTQFWLFALNISVCTNTEHQGNCYPAARNSASPPETFTQQLNRPGTITILQGDSCETQLLLTLDDLAWAYDQKHQRIRFLSSVWYCTHCGLHGESIVQNQLPYNTLDSHSGVSVCRASGQNSCSEEAGRLAVPQLRKWRAGSAARHDSRFVAGYSRREREFA